MTTYTTTLEWIEGVFGTSDTDYLSLEEFAHRDAFEYGVTFVGTGAYHSQNGTRQVTFTSPDRDKLVALLCDDAGWKPTEVDALGFIKEVQA